MTWRTFYKKATPTQVLGACPELAGKDKMSLALVDQTEVLTHGNIIRIGEKIKLQTEDAAEESRQKAIRCTKEMVEREESQRMEEELCRAREEWRKERQQFFQEAHQNQLRAISLQTTILEKRLREEFHERLFQTELESSNHLERTVQRTWEEANTKRSEAEAKVRSEERHLAKEESKRVANRVVQEKKELWQIAEEEKLRALDDHTKVMEDLCRHALAEQQRKLEQHHSAHSKEMSEEYESRLAELNQQSCEQEAEIEKLRNDLEERTESRDSWELKYRNLREEFADFIEQFPGFRAEFILK